jgi:YihY family inner membrane protein
MSTANLVPETWHLTGDDAKKTLAHIGRRRLVKDALTRLRFSDGFSHARSMAFLGILLFVEGVIAAVGISSTLGSPSTSHSIVKTLQSIVPGPAGRLLTQAASQAHQSASSGHWIAILFGTLGALITGVTLMGQIERAMNRLYGIESDRDTAHKYARALLLTLTAGTLGALAFGGLGLGGAIASTLGTPTVRTIWSVARWPLGVILLIAALALILRWAPRRHQPAWSWMSFGAVVAVGLMALVTIVLNVFFHFSSSFGTTYGPLAGIIALAFWSYATAIALLVGAALAAQLEAVRAGAGAPRSGQKTRGSEAQLGASDGERSSEARAS